MKDDLETLEAQLLQDLETIKRFKELKARNKNIAAVPAEVVVADAAPVTPQAQQPAVPVVSPKPNKVFFVGDGTNKQKVIKAIGKVPGDQFDSRLISRLSGLDMKAVLQVFRRLPQCGQDHVVVQASGRRPTVYSKSKQQQKPSASTQPLFDGIDQKAGIQRVRRATPMTQVQAAKAAIEILGRPARLNEIVDLIHARGMPVQLSSLDNLRSVLSRNNEFESNGSGMWALVRAPGSSFPNASPLRNGHGDAQQKGPNE